MIFCEGMDMISQKRSSLFKSIALIMALCLALLSLASCKSAKGAVSSKVGELKENQAKYSILDYHVVSEESLVFVASSGLTELYFDSSTFSIVVKDTNTEKLWCALPIKAEGDEDCLASVLSVKVSKGNQIYYLNSQDNSVAFDSATFKPVNNGIQITYDMALDKKTAQTGLAANDGELYVSITAVFSLSDGTLRARINCGDTMISDGYIVESIDFLNYFGASQKAEKQDFIFVPDQSGAIIRIGASAKDEYEQRNYRVYGKDISMGSSLNTDSNGKVEYANALIPAFGMKAGKNAFVGAIISGDNISTITSHRYLETGTTFNRVGASFRITDVTYSGSDSGKTKYTGEAYTGEIEIDYRFLNDKNASYVGFASACREMLTRESALPNNRESLSDSNIPLSVNVQAAVRKGSAHSYKKLSTYEQVLDMLVLMKAKSINNISIRYKGVLDGANTQDLLSTARPISALGSEKDFEELKQYVTTQKFDMYLDMSLFTYNGKSSPSKNSAKNMAGEAITYQVNNNYSYIAGKTPNTLQAVALSNVEKNVFSFLNDSSNYQFDGFCINDAGKLLYSDYSDDAHNRNNAVNILAPQLLMLSNNHKIMVDTGNLYVLKNADYVTDIKSTTDYPESDIYVQVPFVEIILHGLVDYSLTAVNTSPDPKKAFMKAVEYGAIPSYEWCCTKSDSENADAVYYYENQLDNVAEDYKKSNEALGDLRSSKITDHKAYQEGVYGTHYNNSTVIYFNYTDKAVTVNSVKIEPNSFLRVN